MAVTLQNGAAYKTVDSVTYAEELKRQGWTVASGSITEDKTMDTLHNFSDQTAPTFRGIGHDGESTSTLGFLMKEASVGLTKTSDLKALINAFDPAVAAGAFTKIGVVAALPTTGQSQTTIYVLTVQDGSNAPGTYKYNGTAYVQY